MNPAAVLPRLRFDREHAAKLLAALVLSGGLIALLWTAVDMRQVVRLMSRAAWLPLLLALLVYALDFLLRALRFWMLLDPKGHPDRRFKPTIAPFVASFGVSDILPFRLGDVFRVGWFHARLGWPAGRVIGAMIVERVLDLLAILAIAGAAVWATRNSLPDGIARDVAWLLALAAAATLVVLISPAAIGGICARLEARPRAHWLHGLIAQMREVIAGSQALSGWRMATMLLLSVALWLLESLVMLGAWISLGGSSSDWLKPMVAFGFSTLGTLVPALPGHFGSYDVAGLLSFDALGVPTEQGAATVLLAHLLLWLPTVLFAIAWFLVARPAGAAQQPQLLSAAGARA